MRCSCPTRHLQCRGAVLLTFVMVGIIIASALLLKALNLASPGTTQGTDNQVLKTAKHALLGYAMSYADRNANALPGFLPCPDINGDGLADGPCGVAGRAALGRLPWQTLGLQPLRDSAGECLWYAVSGNYKESPAGTLSTDAAGQFLIFDSELNSLNGAALENSAIAVVFAAGKPLSGQNRALSANNATECGSRRLSDGVNLSANYLDTHNGIRNANGSSTQRRMLGVTVVPVTASGYSAFITSATQTSSDPVTFNDSLMSITSVDYARIYTQMQRWVGERVRQCLNSYSVANLGKLPWPALMNGGFAPVFNDNSAALRFGRIASNLANSQGAGLSPLWPADPQQPGTRCFNWSWWPGFRENTFYALDAATSATGVALPFTLSVDSSPQAGAVFVAGRAGNAQSRADNASKALISNYLETDNIVDAASGMLPPGDEQFVSRDSSATFFNDYVCTLSSCP